MFAKSDPFPNNSDAEGTQIEFIFIVMMAINYTGYAL